MKNIVKRLAPILLLLFMCLTSIVPVLAADSATSGFMSGGVVTSIGLHKHNSSSENKDTSNYVSRKDYIPSWYCMPGILVWADLVPVNTTAEADMWIKENHLSMVYLNNYLHGMQVAWNTNSIRAGLNETTEDLELILRNIVYGNMPTEAQKSDPKIMSRMIDYLYINHAVNDDVYNFYVAHGTEDYHGQKIVICWQYMWQTFWRDNRGYLDEDTYTASSIIGILGDIWSTPFSSWQDCRDAIMVADQNGTAPINPMRGALVDSYAKFTKKFYGYYGSNVVPVSTTVPLLFTNFIESPEGNYYGRGYWVLGDSVPSPKDITVTYDVQALPQGQLTSQTTGLISTFWINLNADASDIDYIQKNYPNQTWRVTIQQTGAGASVATVPNSGTGNISTIGCTKYGKLNKCVLSYNTDGSSADSARCTFTLTTAKLMEMLTGSNSPGVQIKYNNIGTGGNPKCDPAYYSAEFSVSITPVGTIDSKFSGFSCSPKDGTDDCSYGHTYATNSAKKHAMNTAWYIYTPQQEDIPWEFHTTGDPKAYAEIVANEVGMRLTAEDDNADGVYAQDWNVNAGVPSTENLSVAIGGTAFMYDVAGLIKFKGQSSTQTANELNTANSGTGSPMSNPTQTRTITFNVNITDWWGETNPLCQLHCPGHVIFEKTQSLSNEQSGPVDTPGEAGNGKTKTVTCETCGDRMTQVTDGTGHDANVSTGQEQTTANWVPTGHTCNWKITFSCNDGSIDAGACTFSGYTVKSPDSNPNGQRYTITSGNVQCGTESYNSDAVEDTSLLCEGFTTGKGCMHNEGIINCVHRATQKYTFSIVEYVDTYAWRSITQAKVYALTDASIKSVDTNVVNPNAIGSAVSNSNLYATMWHANDSIGHGTNTDTNKIGGQYGRLWYTQFANPSYGFNSGNWTASYVHCAGSTEQGSGMAYWLGDTCIDLYIVCDSSKANDPGNGSTKNGHNNKKGYDSEDSASKEYKDHVGDTATVDQLKLMAVSAVNKWQAANNELYTINVISDNLSVVISQGIKAGVGDVSDSGQTVIGDIYAVDDGIYLFNTPFTAPDQTHYRNHVSKYSATALRSCFIDNAFSVRNVDSDILSGLESGYVGLTSANPKDKYGVKATDINGNNRLVLNCQTLTMFLSNTSDGNTTEEYRNIGHKYFKGRNGCKFTAGEIQCNGNNFPYNVTITDEWKPNFSTEDRIYRSGLLRVDQITTGKTAAQSFVGYYNNHTYEWKSAGDPSDKLITYARKNMDSDKSHSLYVVNLTDHGNANANKFSLQAMQSDGYVHRYLNAMTISNIDMVDTATNGVYKNPIEVEAHYQKIMSYTTDESQTQNKVPERTGLTTIANYSDSHAGTNDIIIQNPVSTEYCAIVGNGSGTYASGVTNEQGEDQRVTSENTDEATRHNYIVMGNTFHLWVSDFGDFYDSAGSWDYTSITDVRGVGSANNAFDDSNGKKILSPNGMLSNALGYANNMFCNTWTAKRYVSFSFPVSYVGSDDQTHYCPIGTLIDLSKVKCLTAEGQLVTMDQPGALHQPSGNLQTFATANPDISSVKYGYDFEFTLLTSAEETNGGEVTIYSIANNAPVGDNPTDITYLNYLKSILGSLQTTNKQRVVYKAQHAAASVYKVEIVGRIGNLALEDTGDFRFSNLFKQAVSGTDSASWLIDNVIKNVLDDTPNTIISTPTDILGDSAGNKKHNTTSINSVSKGNSYFLGKAGPYLDFPLAAYKNNVSEFRTEQLRMGYASYFDIETIGNYYGINNCGRVLAADAEGNPTSILDTSHGPMSVDDKQDDRTYVMTITPQYILYDLVSGEYIKVDLYSGSQGSYERFWTPGNGQIQTEVALYNDVNTNALRWNVGTVERDVTASVNNSTGIPISAFTEEDFIGTVQQIVLDQYDRTYIGSSAFNASLTKANDGGYTIHVNNFSSKIFKLTGEDITKRASLLGLDETSFNKQAQRWYFNIGVPSSTFIVPYEDGSIPSQTNIEAKHEQLRKDHPYSVLLLYADIKVKGEIWTLKYNFEEANNGSTAIRIFGDSDDDIPNEIKQAGKTVKSRVIDPANDAGSGIKSSMVPLVIMDAWNTSADDWTTYGTH